MAVVLAEVDFEKRTVEELEEENRILKEMVQRKMRRPKEKTDLEPEEYTPYKPDGVLKPSAAETIPDYDTFVKISRYLLDNGRSQQTRARNYALFICGIGFGLRFSDLVRLKAKYIWDEDGNYRERIKITEKKTSKFHQCLITEAIRKALDFYVSATSGECKKTKYLFPSQKGGGDVPMTTGYGWRIFRQAQEELNLPFHFSTHSLRHTCLNICLCVDDHVIDPSILMKLQLMANHSNLTTTIGYLDSIWGITDQARTIVSEWMLGRTEKKVLTL